MKIPYISAAVFAVMLTTLFKANAATVTTPQSLPVTAFSFNNSTGDDTYTREEVGIVVRMMISDMNGVDDDDILDEHNLVYDLGLDSYELLSLCSDCMDWFDITIDIYDVITQAQYITVGTFCNMVYYYHIGGESVFVH